METMMKLSREDALNILFAIDPLKLKHECSIVERLRQFLVSSPSDECCGCNCDCDGGAGGCDDGNAHDGKVTVFAGELFDLMPLRLNASWSPKGHGVFSSDLLSKGRRVQFLIEETNDVLCNDVKTIVRHGDVLIVNDASYYVSKFPREWIEEFAPGVIYTVQT